MTHIVVMGAGIDGKEPTHEASWNALCLADFGNTGAAFVAIPQSPPRNVNWTGSGKWVHVAKIACGKSAKASPSRPTKNTF